MVRRTLIDTMRLFSNTHCWIDILILKIIRLAYPFFLEAYYCNYLKLLSSRSIILRMQSTSLPWGKVNASEDTESNLGRPQRLALLNFVTMREY